MKRALLLMLTSFVFGTAMGGTLYFYNNTPYTLKYHVGYKAGLVCSNNEGFIKPNGFAQVETKLCYTDNIWGAIVDSNGRVISGFLQYKGSVNTGYFNFNRAFKDDTREPYIYTQQAY